MKTHKEVLRFRTREKMEIINITREVETAVKRSGIREGLALVYPMHTSSAVYISDSDSSLTQDFAEVLARLVPERSGYRHDETDPKENAHAHMRATLCGHHVILPVSHGGLDLGTYQTVYPVRESRRPLSAVDIMHLQIVVQTPLDPVRFV